MQLHWLSSNNNGFEHGIKETFELGRYGGFQAFCIYEKTGVIMVGKDENLIFAIL